MLLFYFLPKVALSRLIGLLERIPVPTVLRARAYGVYIKKYGVDMSEAAEPVGSFRNFNEFFIRKLKPGLREIVQDRNAVASPVDGKIVTFGKLDHGRIIQAKGLDYSLEGLVAEPRIAGSLLGGSFITIYLAPGDYHRIHSPVDGRVVISIHIPGTLWPVNDSAARSIRDLFMKNERLITGIETGAGEVFLVKIGAFNVGCIRTEYDPLAGRGRRIRMRAYAVPPEVTKGGELARFEMGSSVVLLLPRSYQLAENLREGMRIRMGQAVAARR